MGDRDLEKLGLPAGTRWVSVAVVAAVFGCSRAYVYKLIGTGPGALRARRLPGSRDPRIDVATVVSLAREAGLLDG